MCPQLISGLSRRLYSASRNYWTHNAVQSVQNGQPRNNRQCPTGFIVFITYLHCTCVYMIQNYILWESYFQIHTSIDCLNCTASVGCSITGTKILHSPVNAKLFRCNHGGNNNNIAIVTRTMFRRNVLGQDLSHDLHTIACTHARGSKWN